jgi:hypothetical protein
LDEVVEDVLFMVGLATVRRSKEGIRRDETGE